MRKHKGNDTEKKKEDAKNKKHRRCCWLLHHMHTLPALLGKPTHGKMRQLPQDMNLRDNFVLRRMALSRVKRKDKTFTNWRNEGKSNEKICFYSLPWGITITYTMQEETRSSQATLTYLVEIEGEIPCHRAVQAGLKEGRPTVAEAMWSSTVVFADSGHSGIHCLWASSSKL